METQRMSISHEDIARVAHGVNRTYCKTLLADDSQVAWKDAPEWQKESALQGVRILVQDPSIMPETMHENWMQFKISQGWTYGPNKREDVRQHPCMIPYYELPLEQRVKDYLFRTVVLELLK